MKKLLTMVALIIVLALLRPLAANADFILKWHSTQGFLAGDDNPATQSSEAIGDLNGGTSEVVAIERPEGASSIIHILDGVSGQPLFSYPLGSPGRYLILLRDVDGDGLPDVILSSASSGDGIWVFGWQGALSTGPQNAPPPATRLALGQNHPNPFHPPTTISFSLPEPARVKLVIYDAQGRTVRTLTDRLSAAGSHDMTWDAKDDKGGAVAAGEYFYELTSNGAVAQTRKAIVLR